MPMPHLTDRPPVRCPRTGRALTLVLALAAGCGRTAEEPGTPAFTDIQRIFDQSCNFAGCHRAPPADAMTHLDLSPGVSHAALVDRPSELAPGRTLVIPGDPDGSYLLCMIAPACSDRTADHELTIAPETIEAVRRWIAGGAPGDDAVPPDAGVDVTPPVFAGIDTVTADGEHGLALGWRAAIDRTPPSRIRYRVYLATTPGGEDFTMPLVTVTGVTSTHLGGLEPGIRYRIVVRAVDEADNQDGNTVERDALTADQTAPEFGGVVDATAPAPATIQVSWAAATDNVTPPAAIRYLVFVATSAGGEDFTTPTATVTGVTTATLASLLPSTTYHVVVRAEDAAGNRDANLIERAVTTLDTVPPTFAGLATATGAASAVLLTWPAASDETTAAAELVYLVYRSTTPGGESFASPTYVTAPGVTSFAAGGLSSSTLYYFVVRARDAAGNVDGNLVEKSARTLVQADTLPPTFAGATGAAATGATTIHLTWNPASDNITPAGNMVYGIYRATTSGGQDFTTATYVTAPGVTTFDVGGLAPSTRYFFVVRAFDQAGNHDGNSVQVDATTTGDVTAPTFAGLASATPINATSISLGWAAAADDVSAPAALVYDVYRATTAGGESFAAPTYTSAAGATGLAATGLAPATTYFFVVRARDEAGNHDANVVERSALTTADGTAPTFAGATGASAGATPDRLNVTWNPATDNVTPSAQLVYLLYVATSSGGQDFVAPAAATTAAGATSFTLSGLAASTTYFAVVRARDAAGNVDGNTVQVSATTLADSTRPTFAGVVAAATASSTSINLTWNAGSDDVTPAAQLVYLVYAATTSGGENLAAPTFNTAPGALAATIGGLTPSTTWFFVVRARDQAGNVDLNTIERSAATSGATVSFGTSVQPIFAASCAVAGCHRGPVPAEGLDLSSRASSYAGLVNVNSSECPATKRVRPGSSSQSYLAWKLAGGGPCFMGTMMPKTGSITAAQRNTILTWIDEGALDN